MSALIKLAVRAWPADYRTAHGDELVATATELCQDRSTLREAAGLLLGGMRARYDQATARDRLATWTSAARIAIIVTIASVVAEVLHLWRHGPGTHLTQSELTEVVASGLLVAAGAGLLMAFLPARLFALAGTAAAGLSWIWGPNMPRLMLAGLLVSHLALVWFLGWRNDRSEPRTTLRIGAVAGLIFVLAQFVGNVWISSFAVHFWMTVAALLIAAWDPRLLAGMTLFWLTRLAAALPVLVDQGAYAEWGWVAAIATVATIAGAVRVHRITGRPAT